MSDSARDPVGELMRSAGRGVTPDAARMERAMQRVHGEWHAVLAGRRRRTQRVRWAAALAAVALVSVLAKVLWPLPERAVMVATLTRAVGDVRVGGAPLEAGRAISSGETIETSGTGRALLSLVSGEQLRIDGQSRMDWTSRTDLRLARGAVYIETSGAPGERSSTGVVVWTPVGAVRHIGTRFEVRVADGKARVRVRDGAVTFSRKDEAPVTVAAGQQLSVARGILSIQPGPGPADLQWAWTRDIAPGFSIEGRSLYDTLEWLGRESGLRVVYADERVRSQARRLTLRGSIEGLDTRAALRAVLAGSELGFELHADRIDIFAGPAE
jgi:ferric-dicitrate binding protein FerR (iron transport regulator)